MALTPISPVTFSSSAEIPPNPGALPVLRFLMAVWTSSSGIFGSIDG